MSALLIGLPTTTSVCARGASLARAGLATSSKTKGEIKRLSDTTLWWLSLMPTILVLVGLVAVAAYVSSHGAKIEWPVRDVIGASVPMPDFFGSILTTR